MRIWAVRLLVLGLVGVAAYVFWERTPPDVVGVVRRGDVGAVSAALARDPAAVHTKVYAQAADPPTAGTNGQAPADDSTWDGRYLIHDAIEVSNDPIPVLDVLAAGGADLGVRLHGRTLLHLAAAGGDLGVAAWLLEHGADVHAAIDCADACPELGYTPLHFGLNFRDDAMTELLLSRGAELDAAGADGRTAMHVAAARGKLSGAFVLARHGADVTRPDAAGKTPFDLASLPPAGSGAAPEQVARFAQWFAPNGPFRTVAGMARASGTTIGEEAARRVFAAPPSAPR